jgi:hypothetical protein
MKSSHSRRYRDPTYSPSIDAAYFVALPTFQKSALPTAQPSPETLGTDRVPAARRCCGHINRCRARNLSACGGASSPRPSSKTTAYGLAFGPGISPYDESCDYGSRAPKPFDANGRHSTPPSPTRYSCSTQMVTHSRTTLQKRTADAQSTQSEPSPSKPTPTPGPCPRPHPRRLMVRAQQNRHPSAGHGYSGHNGDNPDAGYVGGILGHTVFLVAGTPGLGSGPRPTSTPHSATSGRHFVLSVGRRRKRQEGLLRGRDCNRGFYLGRMWRSCRRC